MRILKIMQLLQPKFICLLDSTLSNKLTIILLQQIFIIYAMVAIKYFHIWIKLPYFLNTDVSWHISINICITISFYPRPRIHPRFPKTLRIPHYNHTKDNDNKPQWDLKFKNSDRIQKIQNTYKRECSPYNRILKNTNSQFT